MIFKNNFFKVLAFLLLLIWMKPTTAQSLSKDSEEYMVKMEDSLISSADSMFYTLIPDFRVQYCEEFVKQLIRTLKEHGSFQYSFERLNKKINIIYPEDKSFRIFNWPIVYNDVRIRYYAAIQMNSEELKLYPLFDHSELLSKTDENNVLDAKQWIGGLFYNIITKNIEDESVYCLLGINDGNPICTKKFLDPMRMTTKGPIFGMPIFDLTNMEHAKGNENRFILEYKKGVNVGFNWDENYKAVVFDNIASEINDPNRKYTYVPTGEYNSLRWNKDHWKFVNNFIKVQDLKDGSAPEDKKSKKKK